SPPVGQPNWLPVWGGRTDVHVQIAPRRRFFDEVVKDAVLLASPKFELPPNFKYLQQVPADLPPPPPPPLEYLSKLYLGDGSKTKAEQPAVEPHRFALADVQATLAGSYLTSAQAAADKI